MYQKLRHRVISVIILICFLSSCMGKTKDSYNSEAETSYENDLILYSEDLTSYVENLTSYTDELTSYSTALTDYANECTFFYFGEYTDGIYSVQLQSEDYIKSYLEINGVHIIDIEKILMQLCVGSGTIIVTALVLPALPIIAGVSSFSASGYATQVCVMAMKITSEAMIGAAMDAALSGTMKYFETNGDIEQTFYSTIEQSAEGFMWAAVISSAMETVKEVKFVHQAAKEKKAVEETFVTHGEFEKLKIGANSKNSFAEMDELAEFIDELSIEKKEIIKRFFEEFPNDASRLYSEYPSIIDLYEKINKIAATKPERVDWLIKAVNRDGDKAISLLSSIDDVDELRRTIDILANTTTDDYIAIIEKSKKYISTLSEEEKKSISKYTGKSYKTINSDVRNNIKNQDVENLKKVISNNELPESTVYRGSDTFIGDKPIGIRNGRPDLIEGEIIENSAFTSTTLKPQYANGMIKNADIPILCEIKVPNGANGLYISDCAQLNFAKTQQEILLNVNSKFKVVESRVLPKGSMLADGTVLEKDTIFVKMIML